MGYQPKIIRGKVKNTGYPIDGRELLFSLWDYDNYESYHLFEWADDDDEAVMRTMYQTEKEAGLCLFDEFESFEAACKAGDYEPDCMFCLDLDKVKVLEVVAEERK